MILLAAISFYGVSKVIFRDCLKNSKLYCKTLKDGLLPLWPLHGKRAGLLSSNKIMRLSTLQLAANFGSKGTNKYYTVAG